MPDFRIALACAPNTTGIAEKIAPYEHLGLSYLGAVLREKKYNVKLTDSDALQLKLDEAIERIDDFNPDILALSPTWATVDNSIELIKKIKRKNSDLITCFGGYIATFNDREILSDYSLVDYIIRGEGERIFPALIEKLENNKSVENLQSITYRSKDGKIIQNPIAPYIKDLDTIPFPVRDTFEEILQQDNIYILNLITSRGCYGNCSFCIAGAFSRLSKKTPAWRGRSIENVIKELELLLDIYPQIHYINFADNNIFGPGIAGKNRVKRLAQALIDHDINIEWQASARSDNFDKDDDELFKLLKSSNIGTLFIGIESGVESQLELFNKRISVAKNLKTIKLINKWEIPVQWGYIMFNPYIKFEDLIKNAKFYFNKLKYYSIHKMTMKLRVFPGTALYEKIRNDNLLKDSFNYKEIFNYNYLDERVAIVENIMTKTANQLYAEHAILQNAQEMTDTLLSGVLNVNVPHILDQLQTIVRTRNSIYKKIRDINHLNYNYFRDIMKLIKNNSNDTEIYNNKIRGVKDKIIKKHISEIKRISSELDEEFKDFIKTLNDYMSEVLNV
ncbi:MAG: radical SAM protein [Candidatus Lokiarchaeota archaeon]|nr:radical SAM protein [Candidatus Lokiarchaeota archaeon]